MQHVSLLRSHFH